MNKPKAFAVVSSDQRHAVLCCLLRQDGHVAVPVGSLSEQQVVESMPEDAIVLVGSAPPEAVLRLEERGIPLVQYMEDEACLLAHGVITAENAIQVAMEQLDCMLSYRKLLVIGFGRIGSHLAAMLRGLGGRVSVAARRPEALVAIEAAGYHPVPMDDLDRALPRVDLIFNTAPGMVLPDQRLALLPRDTLIIDLASRPGGVDYVGALARGLNVIHALALPGRLAPLSSAMAIREAVYRLCRKDERI